MGLGSLLLDRQSQILQRFVAEVVRKDLAPSGTVKSQLLDHLPEFLDEIVRELEGATTVRASQDAVDVSPTGREHGGQRWGLGYDLEAVVREYGILRHIIFAVARDEGLEPTLDEVDILSKCLNVGVAAAVTEYVAYRDREQEKRAQVELANIEAASRAKDEFVSIVSHELRTPLNAIIGWVRLLRAGSLSAARREHAFEVIERNANAQGRLVADLLDISRVTSGRIRLNASQVDLSNVVEIVVEEARLAIETKRLTVSMDLDRERSTLRGDADRLQQVVWSLLVNAIKFTPKGGAIWISLRRVDSDLELVVKDNGRGIAPELLSAIFESFRQSDSSATREHGGLGIGLSIARHLVLLHGGSVRAESDGLGRGASFIVRLPVSPLVSATPGVTKVAMAANRAAELARDGQLGAVRILVVDDDADARELVGVVLETCGAEVRVAQGAAEAMQLLESFSPQVIVSDIGMPGTDGYAFIRAVRAHKNASHAGTPAVALTAFVRNEDRHQALAAGFNAHLTKPVEPMELVEVVASLAQLPPPSP